MAKTLIDTLLEAVSSLKTERRAIDDKIAALELAHETLTGDKLPDPVTVMPGLRKRLFNRRDNDGVLKTLAFLRERGKPTTIAQMAHHGKTTAGGVVYRMRKLIASGDVEKIDRGTYAAVEK